MANNSVTGVRSVELGVRDLRQSADKRPGHWSDFLREWRLRLGAP